MARVGIQTSLTRVSLSKILLRKLGFSPSESKIMNIDSLTQKSSKDLSEHTIVFDMEGALLKSSSLFPYFMLVAFEAGGLIRSLVLLLSYPFLFLLGKEMEIKIMVFISFFGLRTDKFKVGSAVLPKFFLEDVVSEGFDLVMRFENRIGVSRLPRIMVEGFLKDYIGVESVLGRELMVINGFFVGLMEQKESLILDEKKIGSNSAIGIGCSSNVTILWQLLQNCKEIYSVAESEKRNWKNLERERYPKPLIFHDSRLGFRPTAFSTIAMFMWLPFGLFISLIRIIVGVSLPWQIAGFIHALSGASIIISKTKQPFTSASNNQKPGVLYACNHRTLLDPIYIGVALGKPVSAVTYSMSRFNEMISPIKTTRLSRDRETDRKQMSKMRSQGDVVVCPEGTTCREPYLLRFSPLFAEITDDIVPVAIDVHITMFYGSTAAGMKCLDPIFQLLNPRPVYFIKILEKLPGLQTHILGGVSHIAVANKVQAKIAKTLGFECTNLTRKDKYIILAGNEGIV